MLRTAQSFFRTTELELFALDQKTPSKLPRSRRYIRDVGLAGGNARRDGARATGRREN